MKSVTYLLLTSVISAYCRVAVNDHKGPDLLLSNLIPKDHKLSDSHEGKVSGDKLNHDIKRNYAVTTDGTPSNTCDDPSDNTIDSNKTEPCNSNVKVDNGTALILTSYIKEGRLSDARDACKVDPSLFFGIESYSGFLTVNETYNSNIFFWYFPMTGTVNEEVPWVIWLQGGPGASSLTGLFDEIGPFKVDRNGTLKLNPHTWLQSHSLVFIDNPVGTGYSFTEHARGFTKDMATYGSHLFTAVKQLVQIFPELRTNPLYIAGESYAGKYVPALGMEIHKHKDLPGLDINLQGLIIGNAYVDPEMISHLSQPFYFFGLLEKEQIDSITPLDKAFQEDIAANRSVAAKNKWNSLITLLLFLSHQKHAYNFLRDDLSVGQYVTFLHKPEVKRALHVGDIKFGFVNLTVNIQLAGDFLSSAKPSFETLLEHYKVLTYCGQLDQMLPCVFTSANYRTWKWNASKEFLEATRYPYMFNDKLAGYYKSGGNLTEVVLRGAGHMAPLDVPAPAQQLVARWTHGQPLSKRLRRFEETFVKEFVGNNTIMHYL